MSENTVWSRRDALMRLGAGIGGAALSLSTLPAAAQGQALKTERVADNLHMVSGDGGNIGVLAGPEGLLLADTGYKAQSEALTAALKSIANAPSRIVVNTHWHGDHTDGNEPLGRAGATIAAHANTRKRLSTDQNVEFFNTKFAASPAPALPVMVFDSEMRLYWGTDEIHLTHVPTAHTDSDILLHYTRLNVIHAGDLLFNGFYPFIDYSSKGWIGGMVHGADRILSLSNSSTKIIPGHGPLATRDDVKAFREMLVTVQTRIEKQIKDGKSEDDAIAAKPTADLDAKWGKGFMDGSKFTSLAYRTITRRSAARA